MYASWTFPSLSSGIHKAIHEQQNSADSSIPITLTSPNIRGKSTQTHTLTWTEMERRKDRGRRMRGGKGGQEHCRKGQKIFNTHPSLYCFFLPSFSHVLRIQIEDNAELHLKQRASPSVFVRQQECNKSQMSKTNSQKFNRRLLVWSLV